MNKHGKAITSDEKAKKIQMPRDNPRQVFVKSFSEHMEKTSNTLSLHETYRKQDHAFTPCIMFNIFAKNYNIFKEN